MSIFYFIICFLLAFGALFLATRFLGKTGLFVFAGLTAALSMLYGGTTCEIFGTYVDLEWAFLVPMLFSIYHIFKQYGIADAIRAGIAVMFVFIMLAFISFFLYLFLELGFADALRYTIVPMIFDVFFVAGFVFMLFALTLSSNFMPETKTNIRDFVVCLISVILSILIYVLLSGWNDGISFGEIMIGFLINVMFCAIFFAALIFTKDIVFRVNDNARFADDLSHKTEKFFNTTFYISTNNSKQKNDDDD